MCSTDSVLADESLAAVRRLSEVEPMRGRSASGAHCVNSLVTATCRAFLPSSMASMTHAITRKRCVQHPRSRPALQRDNYELRRPWHTVSGWCFQRGKIWRGSDLINLFTLYILFLKSHNGCKGLYWAGYVTSFHPADHSQCFDHFLLCHSNLTGWDKLVTVNQCCT